MIHRLKFSFFNDVYEKSIKTKNLHLLRYFWHSRVLKQIYHPPSTFGSASNIRRHSFHISQPFTCSSDYARTPWAVSRANVFNISVLIISISIHQTLHVSDWSLDWINKDQRIFLINDNKDVLMRSRNYESLLNGYSWARKLIMREWENFLFSLLEILQDYPHLDKYSWAAIASAAAVTSRESSWYLKDTIYGKISSTLRTP